MAKSRTTLEQQVLVITGASSGIGLAIAAAALARGASVVLCARGTKALAHFVDSIPDGRLRALVAAGDMADPEQMRQVAQAATARFGRIDTWINNADISAYGWFDAVSESDARRLFDASFWGVVNGSFAALPHLSPTGGSLITLDIEEPPARLPLHGIHAAAQRAIGEFCDDLRESTAAASPTVTVSVIHPSAFAVPQTPPAWVQPGARPASTCRIDTDRLAAAVIDAAECPTGTRTIRRPARDDRHRPAPLDVPDLMPNLA